MTIDEMVLCVCTGIAFGITFKLMFELLFFCIQKITSWLQLKN